MSNEDARWPAGEPWIYSRVCRSTSTRWSKITCQIFSAMWIRKMLETLIVFKTILCHANFSHQLSEAKTPHEPRENVIARMSGFLHFPSSKKWISLLGKINWFYYSTTVKWSRNTWWRSNFAKFYSQMGINIEERGTVEIQWRAGRRWRTSESVQRAFSYFNRYSSRSVLASKAEPGILRISIQEILENSIHLFLYRLQFDQELKQRRYKAWASLATFCL